MTVPEQREYGAEEEESAPLPRRCLARAWPRRRGPLSQRSGRARPCRCRMQHWRLDGEQRTLMTSRMGMGWMPERQRHQFRVGVSERNPWSLVASGCTGVAAPLLWPALRAVPGTDDEGGNCGGLEAKLTTTTSSSTVFLCVPVF